MRLNPSSSFLILAVAPLLAALSSGCSLEEIPHVPTYDADIRPLVLSRCVRCHGGGGTLQGDPDALGVYKGFAPIGGYFDHYEDQNCGGDASPADCKHGLFFYATDTAKKMQLTGFINSTAASRMPPMPAPALTSTQLEIFNAWIKDPKEK